MTSAPPRLQVVHTTLAHLLLAPPTLERKLARAEREHREHGDRNGGAERHGEGRCYSCPEQPLRHRKHEHENGSGAGPDAHREHYRHDFSPR